MDHEKVWYINGEGRAMPIPVSELVPGVVNGIHEEFGEICRRDSRMELSVTDNRASSG